MIRHLKTVVQHVFVLDDGETLTEQPSETIVVSAAEWPAYSGETFAKDFAALRASTTEQE